MKPAVKGCLELRVQQAERTNLRFECGASGSEMSKTLFDDRRERSSL